MPDRVAQVPLQLLATCCNSALAAAVAVFFASLTASTSACRHGQPHAAQRCCCRRSHACRADAWHCQAHAGCDVGHIGHCGGRGKAGIMPGTCGSNSGSACLADLSTGVT